MNNGLATMQSIQADTGARGHLEKPARTPQQTLLQGVKVMTGRKIGRSHTRVLEIGKFKRRGKLSWAACSTAPSWGQPRLEKMLLFSWSTLASLPQASGPNSPAEEQVFISKTRKKHQKATEVNSSHHPISTQAIMTICYLTPVQDTATAPTDSPKNSGDGREGRHKLRQQPEDTI